MKTKNPFGMKAVVTLKKEHGGGVIYYRNLTEVHHNHAPYHDHTAFESDIHATGFNIPVNTIHEIEITLETELAEGISE